MAYEKWGQPGDLRRKARYDSGGKDIGDQGFSPLELNLVRAMKELANQMPEMTPAQRMITMVIIGMMVASLVSGCVSPGGAGPVTSIDQGDHQPVASATAIGAVPNVEPVYVDTPDTNIPAVDAPSAVATTQVVASPEATPKPPTPAVTKTPEIRIDAGGEMTAAEMTQFKQLDTFFQGQCRYWGEAPTPVVNLETCPQMVAHIMIDKEGGDMGVAYQAPGEDALYTFPWGPNGPILLPEKGYVDGLPPKGAGPLRLTLQGVTADGVHYRLGWKNHRWVRADDTGKIIEQINDQGVWEAVHLKVELGTDPRTAVFVDWKDWKTAEFSSQKDTFGDKSVWEKAQVWNNERNGMTILYFGELNKVDPMYKDPSLRPIGLPEFFRTVDQNGIELLVMRVRYKNANGSVGEWFFPWEEGKIPAAYKESWYTKTLTNPKFFWFPISANTPEAKANCTGLSTPYICEITETNTKAQLTELAMSGNWPDGERKMYTPWAGIWE